MANVRWNSNLVGRNRGAAASTAGPVNGASTPSAAAGALCNTRRWAGLSAAGRYSRNTERKP
jgi:hypothetical protein